MFWSYETRVEQSRLYIRMTSAPRISVGYRTFGRERAPGPFRAAHRPAAFLVPAAEHPCASSVVVARAGQVADPLAPDRDVALDAAAARRPRRRDGLRPRRRAAGALLPTPFGRLLKRAGGDATSERSRAAHDCVGGLRQVGNRRGLVVSNQNNSGEAPRDFVVAKIPYRTSTRGMFAKILGNAACWENPAIPPGASALVYSRI